MACWLAEGVHYQYKYNDIKRWVMLIYKFIIKETIDERACASKKKKENEYK